MSAGEKPSLPYVAAGTTRRSKRSSSSSCLSAWRGVRPVWMRLSTGTWTQAARCSIASSRGIACSHFAGIAASRPRWRGTVAMYAGTSVACSARASRRTASSADCEIVSPMNGKRILLALGVMRRGNRSGLRHRSARTMRTAATSPPAIARIQIIGRAPHASSGPRRSGYRRPASARGVSPEATRPSAAGP